MFGHDSKRLEAAYHPINTMPKVKNGGGSFMLLCCLSSAKTGALVTIKEIMYS